MDANFWYKGFWWLPDSPNEKFPGDLQIDGSGRLVLSVINERHSNDTFRQLTEVSSLIPVIQGYARSQSTGQDLAFSIFNCSVTSFKISGLVEYSLQVEYATTRNHYNQIDSLVISSIFMEIQLLREWINITGITYPKERSVKKFKLSFDYEQPKPIELFKDRNINLYIWFYARQKTTGSNFELVETPRLNLEFSKEVKYDVITDYMEIIQNLISFCTSLPVSLLKIEYREYSKRKLKKLKVEYQNTCQLILSDNRTFTRQTGIRGEAMLLPFSHISSHSQSFFSQWFLLNEKYNPVFKLYFDTLYNPGLSRENAFLNHVAALEIYHRIRMPDFDGKIANSYQTKYNAILSKITDKNEKGWLETRLGKRKETHLYARIKSLADSVPSFSERVLKDSEFFAHKVANTRHYLTHFDPKNKVKGIAENDELRELIGKTRLLIQMLLLIELGLSEEAADDCVRKAISNWYVWNR